ncbi:hypothetical protein [Tabrizicola sp.]|uniref:hypothetical protein n=1 Tax=Tabrizicola sp. TaxID=2005166 RepID=UPI00286AD980|nr:hypothetical protein [Tabrizicola sp.]
MQRYSVSAALVAASLLCATSASAEMIEGSAFYAGLWKGLGVRDAERNLVMCQVSLSGVQGERIDFSLWSNNRFAILMAPVGVQFQGGQQYDVSIWTNVETAIAVPAVAMGETILIVEFTDIDWAVDYLEDSQILTVTGEGFQQSFSIASANQALAGAKSCLEAYAAPG